jgi:hypothetical protein
VVVVDGIVEVEVAKTDTVLVLKIVVVMVVPDSVIVYVIV